MFVHDHDSVAKDISIFLMFLGLFFPSELKILIIEDTSSPSFHKQTIRSLNQEGKGITDTL